MIVFYFDNTFEGLLTSVFEAYARRTFPDVLLAEGSPLPLFHEEVFTVATDEAKAARVWRGLQKKLSPFALRALAQCWLAEEPETPSLLFRYIRKAVDAPRSIETNFGDADVLAFSRMWKRVDWERLRLLQFVRFQKMADGRYALDYIYDTIPADLLQTEVDTCWVKVAGEDPAAYVKKYTGRSPLVHLKDFHKEGRPANMYQLIGTEVEEQESHGTFEFRPVGHGDQDFGPILEASVEAGAQWVVVEQDQSNGRTPMEAITLSRQYLKEQGW